MSRASRAHQRLAVRYFDDRILLTDTSAWAYFRLPTVSYEFVTPEEREALATNITIALAAIRMPDAEVHLRVAHRTYPAAEWAMALNATSDEGSGLARLSGGDVPARLGEGLLVQGGLSRRTARAPGQAARQRACSRSSSASTSGREKALGPRRRPRAGRRDRAAGPSRPNGWAGRWPPAPCTPGTPPPSRWRGCSSTRRRGRWRRAAVGQPEAALGQGRDRVAGRGRDPQRQVAAAHRAAAG